MNLRDKGTLSTEAKKLSIEKTHNISETSETKTNCQEKPLTNGLMDRGDSKETERKLDIQMQKRTSNLNQN